VKSGYRWAQGRSQYLRVILTGREYRTLTEWAWIRREPAPLVAIRDALVGVDLERPMVAWLKQQLAKDGLPRLASACAEALETVRDLSDLSSDERTVIHRLRRVVDGDVVVHVRHGTPVVEPERHWHWGQGRRRRRAQAAGTTGTGSRGGADDARD